MLPIVSKQERVSVRCLWRNMKMNGSHCEFCRICFLQKWSIYVSCNHSHVKDTITQKCKNIDCLIVEVSVLYLCSVFVHWAAQTSCAACCRQVAGLIDAKPENATIHELELKWIEVSSRQLSNCSMKKKTQAFRISVFGVKRQNERQVAQCVICEATDSSLFFVTKFARNFFFDSAEILRAGPIMNAYRVFQLSRFFTCCFPRGFLALLILRVRILWLPLFWCRQFLSIYSILVADR